MSNQAQATTPANLKGFDVEKLKDDEILKLEAEMKAKLELLQKAKGEREEKIKSTALTEIKSAIDKLLESEVVTGAEFTQFLVTNGYVVAPKAHTLESTGKVGRRAINDEDLLFSVQYTSEDSGRSQTLKLDAQSDKPAPKSGAFKELEKLQAKTFEELKPSFTKKFFEEFLPTDASFMWVEKFFPKLQPDFEKMIAEKK